MFWCVLLLYIFTSCAVLWQAHRVSQNANEYQENSVYHRKHYCSIIIGGCETGECKSSPSSSVLLNSFHLNGHCQQLESPHTAQ